MAKPDSWRLDPASYPVSIALQTRFQDMDINGHINNVAFAVLFESGRVLLNTQMGLARGRVEGENTLVAAVSIAYLREGNYPDPVIVFQGIGPIGTSSFTIQQAMFQNDQCIATCDAIVASRANGAAAPLKADLRGALEANQTRGHSAIVTPAGGATE
jgi:acyl-CoA thioester hydrolase